jgi:hypothetical protein
VRSCRSSNGQSCSWLCSAPMQTTPIIQGNARMGLSDGCRSETRFGAVSYQTYPTARGFVQLVVDRDFLSITLIAQRWRAGIGILIAS